jgi:hypothetical protein
VNKYKTDYIEKCRNSSKMYFNNCTLPLKCSPVTILLPWFIFPTNDQMPLLPLPNYDIIIQWVPPNVKHACSLNLGYICFEYAVNEVDDTFVLSMYFIANGQKKLIKEMKYDYCQGVYKGLGSEAAWRFWVGGNYCVQPQVPRVKIATWQWGRDSWDIRVAYSTIPVKTINVGMIDKLDSRICDVIGCATTISNQEYKKVGDAYVRDLQNYIKTEECFEELDITANTIIGYLNLVFRDAMESNLVKFGDLILGKQDMINKADVKVTNTSDKLISDIMTQIAAVTPSNTSLKFVTNLCEMLINYYKDNVVKFNKWYRSEGVEQVMDTMLKETVSSLSDILNMAMSKETVDSKDIIQVMSTFAETMDKQVNTLDVDEKRNLGASIRMLVGNKLLLGYGKN